MPGRFQIPSTWDINSSHPLSKPVYMDPHFHLYHTGGQINLEGTCSIPARMHRAVGLKPLWFYRRPESMLA